MELLEHDEVISLKHTTENLKKSRTNFFNITWCKQLTSLHKGQSSVKFVQDMTCLGKIPPPDLI